MAGEVGRIKDVVTADGPDRAIAADPVVVLGAGTGEVHEHPFAPLAERSKLERLSVVRPRPEW
jgi:hypothetical protein